jgi:predicted transcriptional regulator
MATVDKDLVERIDMLADLEDRSRSQMVELLLLAGLPRWEEASTDGRARAALLGRAARRWS